MLLHRMCSKNANSTVVQGIEASSFETSDRMLTSLNFTVQHGGPSMALQHPPPLRGGPGRQRPIWAAYLYGVHRERGIHTASAALIQFRRIAAEMPHSSDNLSSNTDSVRGDEGSATNDFDCNKSRGTSLIKMSSRRCHRQEQISHHSRAAYGCC